MTLFPLAKEVLDNANDLCVSRDELMKFMQDIQEKNRNIEFDLSLMEDYDPDKWFVQILENQ